MSLLSCNNDNAAHTAAQSNEQLVRRYFEHFNNHDWSKMANMYVETAEFKDPTLGKGIMKQTREQVAKKYSDLHQVFPNIKDDIVHLYPSGNNHIVVEFISRGTAADNSTFELPICTIFMIENGLITKDFSYFDNFEE
jgi:ketosteroid isomerase-like protein